MYIMRKETENGKHMKEAGNDIHENVGNRTI